jgi:hypothetical protein
MGMGSARLKVLRCSFIKDNDAIFVPPTYRSKNAKSLQDWINKLLLG